MHRQAPRRLRKSYPYRPLTPVPRPLRDPARPGASDGDDHQGDEHEDGDDHEGDDDQGGLDDHGGDDDGDHGGDDHGSDDD